MSEVPQQMTVIDRIDSGITYLQERSKSQNIVELSQALNKLSILLVTMGHQVSDAYELMNELEQVYEVAYEKEKLTLINSKVSIGKAEGMAELAVEDKKKDFITAKNGYRRLNTYLERVDSVRDQFKQYISSLKDERKLSS